MIVYTVREKFHVFILKRLGGKIYSLDKGKCINFLLFDAIWCIRLGQWYMVWNFIYLNQRRWLPNDELAALVFTVMIMNAYREHFWHHQHTTSLLFKYTVTNSCKLAYYVCVIAHLDKSCEETGWHSLAGSSESPVPRLWLKYRQDLNMTRISSFQEWTIL